MDKHYRLYWSEEALARWPDTEKGICVIMHEIRHPLYGHHKRGKGKDPKLFNIAGDIVINSDPELAGLPDGCVKAEMFGFPLDLFEEEYYEKLIEMAEHGTGNGTGQHGCRGETGKLEGMLEDGDDPDTEITECDRDNIRRDVAQAIKDYAQQNPGKISTGELVWADATLEELEKRIPWQTVLRAKVKAALSPFRAGQTDIIRHRLSRRWHTGMPLSYRMAGTDPIIGVIWDTSGSMWDTGGLAMGVVKQLKSSTKSELREWDCDGVAVKKKGKVHVGGGGSDMAPGIEAALKECHVVVVVTDGYAFWPAEPPKHKKVVIVVLGEGDKSTLPTWAELVYVDQKSNQRR